jgi:hypothetical protein
MTKNDVKKCLINIRFIHLVDDTTFVENDHHFSKRHSYKNVTDELDSLDYGDFFSFGYLAAYFTQFSF